MVDKKFSQYLRAIAVALHRNTSTICLDLFSIAHLHAERNKIFILLRWMNPAYSVPHPYAALPLWAAVGVLGSLFKAADFFMICAWMEITHAVLSISAMRLLCFHIRNIYFVQFQECRSQNLSKLVLLMKTSISCLI